MTLADRRAESSIASGIQRWRFDRAALWLFGVLLLSRVFVTVVIDAVPGMDPPYMDLGKDLFEGTGQANLYYPPSYPTILYGINLLLNDWKLTAQVTYVVFSTLTGVLCYVIVRNLFGARTAREALIIVICLPSLTAAVAGWAHKEVVTLLFMYLTAHGFWTLLSRPTIATVIATAAAAAVTVVLRTDAIL